MICFLCGTLPSHIRQSTPDSLAFRTTATPHRATKGSPPPHASHKGADPYSICFGATISRPDWSRARIPPSPRLKSSIGDESMEARMNDYSMQSETKRVTNVNPLKLLIHFRWTRGVVARVVVGAAPEHLRGHSPA